MGHKLQSRTSKFIPRFPTHGDAREITWERERKSDYHDVKGVSWNKKHCFAHRALRIGPEQGGKLRSGPGPPRSLQGSRPGWHIAACVPAARYSGGVPVPKLTPFTICTLRKTCAAPSLP